MTKVSLFFGSVLSMLASGLAQADSTPPSVVVREVSTATFCARLEATLGQAVGDDPVAAAALTASVVTALHGETLGDFVDLSQPKETAQAAPLLPMAGLFGAVMGAQRPVTLLLTVDELRFLPHLPRSSDLVVMVGDATTLTQERAKQVAIVARALDVHIYGIWTGESKDAATAMPLFDLTAVTGGAFARTPATCNRRL